MFEGLVVKRSPGREKHAPSKPLRSQSVHEEHPAPCGRREYLIRVSICLGYWAQAYVGWVGAV